MRSAVKIISLLFLVLLQGVAVQAGITSGGKVVDYNNVVIGRDISVPGNLLCNDGVFIYYKNKESCAKSGKKNCTNLSIGPINQAERIYIDKDISITQFYKVSLVYEKKTYSRTQAGRKKTSIDVKVPYCVNRDILKPSNVFTEREASDEEIPVLASLYLNGMDAINTPFGPVKSIKKINYESHDIRKLPLLMLTNIRSPFCGEPNVLKYLEKISGEYSGNGWRRANMEYLQGTSGEVVEAKLSKLESLEDYYNARYVCLRTYSI